jgi:hypothetical protein
MKIFLKPLAIAATLIATLAPANAYRTALFTNVSDGVIFSEMVVGCRDLEQTLDQPQAYRIAGRDIYSREKTQPCQFFDKGEEFLRHRIASSSAWPEDYSAMCIGRSSFDCFWVITPKTKVTVTDEER